MSRLLIIALSFLVVGCAQKKTLEYCYVPMEKRDAIVGLINEYLRGLATEHIRYEASSLLTNGGRLFKGRDGCYTSIHPEPVNPDYGIYDGGGGLYIDPETLKVGPHFWYEY